MKTLVVDAKKQLSVVEVPMPQIGECDALVKTLSCGICNGTDTKLIHHTFKGYNQYPAMLGHEAVGRVVEVGSKVTSYKLGDVVLLPFTGDLGEYHSAWGGYGEYAVANDVAAYKQCMGTDHSDFPECSYAQQVVPPEIDPVDAAMIITFREVLSSIKTFGIAENNSVLVFGAGPVGLTFIKFMRLLGVGPIIACDIVPEKLLSAKEQGAHHVFHSQQVDIEKEVLSLCPQGVDFVLDAVGISALINQAMPLIRNRGKICCYGISANTTMNLDWTNAPYNWSLQFQQFPSKYEEALAHNQIVSWILDGVLNPRDFISDIVPFAQILEAFNLVEARQIAKKCVVVYE